MSNRRLTVERIGAEKIIPIIRGDGMRNLVGLIDGLSGVGFHTLEITMTTPGALDEVGRLRSEYPSLTLGVGSVLNAEMAQDAARAGAQFIVSPVLDAALIEASRELDTAVISGAFTPTEAQKAWEAGADLVKIFPASVLGSKYLTALLAPLPHLHLIPTGGIDLANARAFLEAGAFALCLGGALIDGASLHSGEYDGVIARAEELARIVRDLTGGASGNEK